MKFDIVFQSLMTKQVDVIKATKDQVAMGLLCEEQDVAPW